MRNALVGIVVLLGVISWNSVNCSAVSFPQIDPEKWDSPGRPVAPALAPASDDGELAVSTFKIPPGWKIELYAAEPMVANPVAFHVDYDGTVLVCESYRQQQGIEDNRGHGHWLLDDLAAQTIEDRRDYILKHLGSDAVKYTEQDDRIRLLRDSDRDGRADVSKVYADGFNTLLSGTGAGVLRYRGMTYYTCIPDVWLLRGSEADPDIASSREVLHRGYGVRFAFRGHDSHAPIIGPDGRLYFSIGDRGYNVQTENARLHDAASGAVFRCNLDGSDLQVVATGLRNPQGLAFDEYGNLFTCDNNSDSGDQAKWFYIVRGGEYGWRMHYQYLPDRGPYNREKLWNVYDSLTTPAYVIPPIANVSDGPSGLAYYPGTGLDESWLGSFFLCDFRGQTSVSGLRRLKNEPNGAFFRLSTSDEPIWQILATDAKFSASGELFILDWVEGWVGEGKGRIYRAFDPKQQATATVQETSALLAGKLWSADAGELRKWLGHPDQRVRQEAQFELVRRGEIEVLLNATGIDGKFPNDTDRLAQLSRVHGIWGSFQWYRQNSAEARQPQLPRFLKLLESWLGDPDPVIRAIAAQQSEDLVDQIPWEPLVNLIADPDARVSYFAMMTLGKQKVTEAGFRVIERLNANADSDPIVRHGGIMALAGMDDSELWQNAIKHSSPSVRLAAVAALRRVKSPLLHQMLNDGELRVATEAARAIYDLGLFDQWPSLADSFTQAFADDGYLRRVINVNFRMGEIANAQRLAEFAASNSGSLERRVEALQRLLEWDQEVPLDPVLNEYRPRAARNREDAILAIRRALPLLLASSEVATKAGEVAASLGIVEVAPILESTFNDHGLSGKQRASALRSWYRIVGAELTDQLVELTGSDPAVEVRAAALELLAIVDVNKAIGPLQNAVLTGSVPEQQSALRAAATLSQTDFQRQLLAKAMEQATSGKLAPGARLELMEALSATGADKELEQLQAQKSEANVSEIASRYPELLMGGDADKGRQVFFEKTEVSCVRCHAIRGIGGAVGPDLSKIGTKERSYLLEAVIEPNSVIAEGFETQLILDLEGVTHFGVVKQETAAFVELMNAEGQLARIPLDEIEERRRGQSSMPSDIKAKLTNHELRDLVEYLANLRDQP